MSKTIHKKAKFLSRIVLIILAVIIAFLLILTGIFYFNKDDIGKTILLRINNVQPGELAFEDLAFNPFAHLPNISIELKDVDFFEYKNEERRKDTLPIIKLEKLYIAFDVIDLMKGNVNVSQIILENGKVDLITYSDSSFNLTNAIGLQKDKLLNDLDTTEQEQVEFNLDLNRIALNGILVTYNNIPNNTISSYSISSLDASLNIQDEIINSDIEIDFEIIEVNQSGGFLLNNKRVRIESSLSYNKSLNTVQIDPSKLSFDKANFTIEGNLDLNQTGFIDVSITGDDKDFSVLSLFLSETGVNNIKGGNLFFTGLIKGQIFDEIPMIDLSFGIKDVEIQIPNTKERISQLNFSGKFKSGEKKDLSQASIKIEELKAILPGGDLKGHFSIENFAKPFLDIEYKMMAEIDGFDKIFNINIIDSLTGNLEVYAKYIGTYDLSTKTIVEETDSSTIGFMDLSFIIPDVTHVSKMNGMIQLKNDTTYFNDFKLEIGTSDFEINGSLTNLLSLIFNVDKKIEGNLKILSSTYDFPDFFKYDSIVATSFPYQIKDINLNVNVLTSSCAFTNFIATPLIVFDIRMLKAEVEEFLPPIKINHGVFTLGLPFDTTKGDSSLNLDFSDFNIELAGSKLETDVVFNSPKSDPNWLKVDLEAGNLNPQKTFVYWSQDSISNYLNGKMDGSMHLDLIFSLDTIDFDKLDFNAESLGFINSTDTFNFSQLNLKSKEIDFEISKSTNILKTLSFNADLTIKELNTNHFNANDLDYDIIALKGIYNITLNHSQFFDQIGEGTVILNPFGEIPKYEIKYKVKQFEVSNLFDTFKEDTIASGKMDLDLDLRFAGNDLREIKHKIDGRILLGGKNLTFYGLDMDKVIDRFKRSQSFNLTDVGAVVLMGPAGLLVTKGSDFASLVVLNPGEMSKVAELSSDWEFNNGKMNLADVAFTTRENRMAAKGWVNLITDSLSIEIALLNELGCSIYSQEMFGQLDSLELSKVKVMKSLLAPVTNLVTNEKKCDVFYDGKVMQPEKQKKKDKEE